MTFHAAGEPKVPNSLTGKENMFRGEVSTAPGTDLLPDLREALSQVPRRKGSEGDGLTSRANGSYPESFR